MRISYQISKTYVVTVTASNDDGKPLSSQNYQIPKASLVYKEKHAHHKTIKILNINNFLTMVCDKDLPPRTIVTLLKGAMMEFNPKLHEFSDRDINE